MRALFSLLILLSACTMSSVDADLQRAKNAEQAENYKEASDYYKRVIQRDPESKKAFFAAKKISNIAVVNLQDYKEAIFAYNHILLYSDNNEDKIKSLEQLGRIYFEKLTQYSNAIEQLQRYIEMIDDPQKIIEAKLMIARSYFYMNKMYQAEVELKEIIAEKDNSKLPKAAVQNFVVQAYLLLANIKHSDKQYDEAISLYNLILKDYPVQAQKENVMLSLAICYEDTKQIQLAIDTLNKMKDSAQDRYFIEQKISRLKEKMAQQPGARGLKK